MDRRFVEQSWFAVVGLCALGCAHIETSVVPLEDEVVGERALEQSVDVAKTIARCGFDGPLVRCQLELRRLCSDQREVIVQHRSRVERRIATMDLVTDLGFGIAGAGCMGFAGWMVVASEQLAEHANSDPTKPPVSPTAFRVLGAVIGAGCAGLLAVPTADGIRSIDTTQDTNLERRLIAGPPRPCGVKAISGGQVVLRTWDGAMAEAKSNEAGEATFDTATLLNVPPTTEVRWGLVEFARSAHGDADAATPSRVFLDPTAQLLADHLELHPSIDQLDRFRARHRDRPEWTRLAGILDRLRAEEAAQLAAKEDAARRDREEAEAGQWAEDKLAAQERLGLQVDDSGRCAACGDADILDLLQKDLAAAAGHNDNELVRQIGARLKAVRGLAERADLAAHLKNAHWGTMTTGLVEIGALDVDVRDGRLVVDVDIIDHGSNELVAASLGFAAAMYRKRAPSSIDVEDSNLLSDALVIAQEAAIALLEHSSTTMAPSAEAERDARALKRPKCRTPEYSSEITRAEIKVRLVVPRAEFDRYARQVAMPPKVIRRGHLSLSRDQLLLNNWDSILEMATRGPLFALESRSSVRKYVLSWKTW